MNTNTEAAMLSKDSSDPEFGQHLLGSFQDMQVLPIFNQPYQFWLYSLVFSLFLPPEIIVNIIGDDYRLIVIFKVFVFFSPLLGVFLTSKNRFCVYDRTKYW